MPNCFAKSQRLLCSQNFHDVFLQPQKAVSTHLVMLAVPNTQALPRLGLAITKKTVRNAVDRNRVKRIVRESFRHQPNLLDMDVVVLARYGIEHVNKTVLREQTDQLWLRLAKRFQP